ncbi:MAG: RrF2 family transcriptional regulator [Ruminococcus sp.]
MSRKPERGGSTIKISTKVECGIIALIDIALHSENGEAVAVSSISKRQNISVKYLEQILMVLRQSNLVRSTKGFKGGYVLTRPAKEISLRTVIDALDVTVLADVHFQEESETPLKTLVNHQLWNPMTTYLRKFCDSITISDMMEQYRTFLSDTEGPMYYI